MPPHLGMGVMWKGVIYELQESSSIEPGGAGSSPPVHDLRVPICREGLPLRKLKE